MNKAYEILAQLLFIIGVIIGGIGLVFQLRAFYDAVIPVFAIAIVAGFCLCSLGYYIVKKHSSGQDKISTHL